MNGKLSWKSLAKTFVSSAIEPFSYLVNNSKHVWAGKPKNKTVKRYGKEMGNVLQMVAGNGAALKILTGVIPKLSKMMSKIKTMTKTKTKSKKNR